MPAEFHFLRPEWLWAIPAVIATAVLLARRQLGPGSWQRVVDPALAPHVLSGSAHRKSDLRWWLLGITGVIGVLSLAGPAWQRIEQPVFRSDQALVVALDLSRSMDAQDVTPSRMLRARLKILDILDRRASHAAYERHRHDCGSRQQPEHGYHAESRQLPCGRYLQGTAAPRAGRGCFW
jgi:Ca-activated chloride channel family protein